MSAVTEGDEKLEEEDEEEDEGSDNSDSDDDTSVAATAEKHGKDIWSGGSAKKSARSGGTKTTRKSRRFGLEAGTKVWHLSSFHCKTPQSLPLLLLSMVLLVVVCLCCY